MASGYSHSLSLDREGNVWAWGRNNNRQLGDGTNTDRNAPVSVSGLSGVIAIAAGANHNFALKANGTVLAWGRNNNGQLGDATTTDRNTPVKISGLTGEITAIALLDRLTVWRSIEMAMSWRGDITFLDNWEMG